MLSSFRFFAWETSQVGCGVPAERRRMQERRLELLLRGGEIGQICGKDVSATTDNFSPILARVILCQVHHRPGF
jgi:hypothetical protein